jgi:hypothetical protein
MEKSTISALIIAGATVAGGILQALALRAAKRKRRIDQAEETDRTPQSSPASEPDNADGKR